MAPFPEEVDVFSEPHSRMKRLVEVYSEKLSSTDFLNDEALESLLHSLQQTFFEFKKHEQIENMFIMRKLENKLKALSIHDAKVCNCHNDSKLVEMLALVRDGYCCTRKPYIERQNYALKLQNALSEFTEDFIPHMREEEEVFQPLLMKYFEYDELKLLKERVLFEHTRYQEEHLTNEESLEKEACEANIQSDKDETIEEDDLNPFLLLPPELVSNIFSYLSPYDLVKASEVCRSWNQLAYESSFWKHLSPCQWASGNWNWKEDYTGTSDAPNTCMCTKNQYFPVLDEDADQDDLSDFKAEAESLECGTGCLQQKKLREKSIITGITQFLLPKVGPGVHAVHLSQSTALTSRTLLSILRQCPNLRFLDVSYTNITDSAFKRLQDYKACHHLEHLDMSGCSEITDLGLKRLADCFRKQPKHRTVYLQQSGPWRVQPWECNALFENPYCNFLCQLCPLSCSEKNRKQQTTIQPRMKLLSLSGCHQITDAGIRFLSNGGLLSHIEHLDVSGCWQLTGPCLEEMVHCAPQLPPEGLYYCNYIQNGPFQEQANGCDNLECTFRACCCKGD